MITRRMVIPSAIASCLISTSAESKPEKDIIDKILTIGMRLDKANVPEQGRSIIISMDEALELYNYWGGNLYDIPIPGKRMGMLDRFHVFVREV